jgi:biopolymer transport protein ExbD
MLKKVKRVGISIDMTPLVDIAFLMLIFFMATTQFKPPDKDEINLPESQSEIKTPEGHVITIAVTEDNRMSIEYRAGGKRENPYLGHAEDLRIHLRAARVANPRAYILIKADENASYGMMQDIMTILQEENATRFNIITDRETTGGPVHAEG